MGQGKAKAHKPFTTQTYNTDLPYTCSAIIIRRKYFCVMDCYCCGRHCSRRVLVKLMLRRQWKWSLRTMIAPKITSQLLACQNIPWIIFILKSQSSGSEVRMFPRRQENQESFGGFSIVVLTGMSLT